MKTIKVTEQHIKKGLRHCEDGCPVALALHDSGYPGALVSQAWWRPDDKGKDVVELPFSAASFICKFDDGDVVAPFEFETEEPAS